MSGREITLVRQLLLFALAATLPLLAFSVVLVVWLSEVNEQSARQGLITTARALSLAVDERAQRQLAGLAGLATSPALDEGDIDALDRQSRAVAERLGGWVAISLLSGQQIVNTLVPAGSPLPVSPLEALPATLFQEGKDHVSNLFFGPLVKRLVIATSVAAKRNDRVTHALHLGLFPETLKQVLREQQLPEGWSSGLIDGNGKVVVRIPGLSESVGGLPPSWYGATTGQRSGVIAGVSRDGLPILVAFERLLHAPWMVAVAMPSAQLARTRQLPLAFLVGGGVVFVGAISGAFLMFGARLSRSMRAVARAARMAVRGEPVLDVPVPRISELSAMRSAVIELSSKQLLLREADHRIKNSLQLVSGTLRLHGRHTVDEEARNLFNAVQAQVQAIARLHERFYVTERREVVDAFELTRTVCGDISAMAIGSATVDIHADGAAYVTSAAATSYALILAELVTNAIRHAFKGEGPGKVEVRCRIVDQTGLSVTVSDNGPGLPADFDIAAQRGLGLRMSLVMASQIGGKLQTLPSKTGATFELLMPAQPSSTCGATFQPCRNGTGELQTDALW